MRFANFTTLVYNVECWDRYFFKQINHNTVWVLETPEPLLTTQNTKFKLAMS